MTLFNKLYLYVFSLYKENYKQKANTIALAYVSILQISLVFLSGAFLAAFLNQMHVRLMGLSKAVTIFTIIAIVIHFLNWMSYSGKSRKEMNAKYVKISKPDYNVKLLFCLPIIAIFFAIFLLQSV